MHTLACAGCFICSNHTKKASHTRYQVLGPELILVYRQSARELLKSSTRQSAVITFRHTCGCFPSHRASPPIGWYLFYRPTEGRRLSQPGHIAYCFSVNTTRVGSMKSSDGAPLFQSSSVAHPPLIHTLTIACADSDRSTCAKVIIRPRRGRWRATSFNSLRHSWNCQQQKCHTDYTFAN